MQVLAVASQKGGPGKTTLAAHLAVAAELAGAGPVALVDADPQASLSHWWNAREAETPVFVRTKVERLAEDIKRMVAFGIRLLIIDTPPAITRTIEDVIKVSDLVLIPSRPSPHDLRAASATIEIVERMGRPMVFAINGASARARITSEAVFALSQHGTLAPAIIHQRTDFASSMIDGRTVMELDPGSPSAEEIMLLWEYLNGRIARVAGRAESRAAETRPTLQAPIMSSRQGIA